MELLANVMEIIQFLVKLTEIVCVIVLLGYVVSRAKFFRAFLHGERPRLYDRLLVAGIFGLFSIYGTIGGVQIGGAVLNVRDAGPMIAGLVGGPVSMPYGPSKDASAAQFPAASRVRIWMYHSPSGKDPLFATRYMSPVSGVVSGSSYVVLKT